MGNNNNIPKPELLRNKETEKNSSAERELLKAIESGSRESYPASPRKVSDNQVIKKISGFALKMKENISSGMFSLTLNDVKKLLAGLAVFLVIWLIFMMVRGLFGVSFVPNYRNSSENAVVVVSTEKEIPVEGYSYYSDVLLGRNIFKPMEAKAVDSPAFAGSNTADSKAKNLKVTGVAWVPGTEEKYALIEDIKTGITYFLKENDMVSSMKVIKISEDKVTLSYMSEEIVLR